MAIDDAAAWKVAEETIAARFTAVDGRPPTSVKRYNEYPGFFTVAGKSTWEIVLAHGGEVFAEHCQTLAQAGSTGGGAPPPEPDEAKGLQIAGAYFRAIDLLARSPKSVDVQDMLEFFGALPHEPGSRPRDYVSPTDPSSPDAPHLVEKDGSIELTVTYPVEAPTAPEHQVVGRQQSVVARWTLTIPPTYQLSWRREEIVVDND